MLPKTRIGSAICLGFGLLFLVLGVLIPRYVINDGRLPLNLSNTTMRIVDEDAGITRQIHVEMMEPADRNSVTVRAGLTTYSNDGAVLDDLYTAEVWSYRVDRLSGLALGEATISSQMASPVTNDIVSGVWMKFPTNAQQTMYQFFDYTLRQPSPAIFSGAEERDGRTLYHYHQRIEPTNVALLYNSVFNTTVIDGETYYLFHSVDRDIVVDQLTGLIVSIQEDVHDYYGDLNGELVQDALSFNGTTPEDQQSVFLAQAAAVPTDAFLHRACWVMIALGIALAILGGSGTFGAVDGRVRRTVKFVLRILHLNWLSRLLYRDEEVFAAQQAAREEAMEEARAVALGEKGTRINKVRDL
ncbi:MAG: DUF3068 domain-containing protein [Corynebacterium sp.]|nr:DUF3068 domain-containing protein [Corynebacterium sp.]